MSIQKNSIGLEERNINFTKGMYSNYAGLSVFHFECSLLFQVLWKAISWNHRHLPGDVLKNCCYHKLFKVHRKENVTVASKFKDTLFHKISSTNSKPIAKGVYF